MEPYDVYIYIGDVHRDGHLDVTNAIKSRKSEHGLKENVLFCVATYGGDPSAGYRIGRALQHNYKHITMLIAGPCKSAGTLMAVAAHKLLIGDMGELGPLDIQLKKNDEMGELSSGLVIATALDELKDCALSAFRTYIIDIKYRNQLSTKMSADIAAKLAESLIAPMAAQIDPIKLGEHQRAMNIALSYGNRLNSHAKNLKEASLSRLIAGYPAHGFVIDRKEARELFNDVESPEGFSQFLYDIVADKIFNGELSIAGSPEVRDLTANDDEEVVSPPPTEDTKDDEVRPEEGNGDSESDSGTAKPTGSKPDSTGDQQHEGAQQEARALPTNESDEEHN